jgi:hypothetical protein
MPERESSENSLTSRHLSDKPDGMKLRSDSVANGDIISELDTKSKTFLHPPPEGRGFTDSLVICTEVIEVHGSRLMCILSLAVSYGAGSS